MSLYPLAVEKVLASVWQDCNKLIFLLSNWHHYGLVVLFTSDEQGNDFTSSSNFSLLNSKGNCNTSCRARPTLLSLQVLRKRKSKSIRRIIGAHGKEGNLMGVRKSRAEEAHGLERAVIAFENFSLFPWGKRWTHFIATKVTRKLRETALMACKHTSETELSRPRARPGHFISGVHGPHVCIARTRSGKKRPANTRQRLSRSLDPVRAESAHKKGKTGYRIKAISPAIDYVLGQKTGQVLSQDLPRTMFGVNRYTRRQ